MARTTAPRRRDPGLPDDWNAYYRDCPRCGERYHLSEGGCGCADLDDDAAEALRDEQAARDAAADDAAHDRAEARADEQRWAEERVWP